MPSASAFSFVAHEIGDANRSARVERPFWFIENNFLAGRTFSSWEDLNQQARQWCDKVNSTYKKHIRAVPRELFAVERLHLKPLPAWIPEVYRLHQRMVDIEGYVALHTNRYSVPLDWIGRRVEVRETKDKIEIQLDARHLVTHRRIAEAEHQRVLLAEHRPPRGPGHRAHRSPSGREGHPRGRAGNGRLCRGGEAAQPQDAALALRQLLRLVREYPREPLLGAVREAARYGLYDLDRLERMILRRVAREYFLLDDGRSHTMTEELEQLLKNLQLRRILEIYDEQLRAADKDDITYSEFVTRLVRAQWHARQEGALEWRIRRANLPERWSLETFPFARQPGVNRKQIRGFAELEFIAKAENIVLVGPDRRRQNGTGLRPAAEGVGERLPLPVHPRAGSVR